MRPAGTSPIAFLEPRGVDDRESEIAEARLAFAPVAGDARPIIDKASFLPTSRLNRVDLPTFGRPMIAMVNIISPALRQSEPCPRAVGRAQPEPRGRQPFPAQAARLAGLNEAEERFGPLAQRGRRARIGNDHVEPAPGRFEIPPSEVGKSEQFADAVVIGEALRRERREFLLEGLRVIAVDAQKGRAGLRHVLERRIILRIGGESLKARDRRGGIAARDLDPRRRGAARASRIPLAPTSPEPRKRLRPRRICRRRTVAAPPHIARQPPPRFQCGKR